MFNSKNALVTATIVGIVGLLLIIFENRGDVLNWIVIALGIMFIIPGAYGLITQLAAPKPARDNTAIATGVGSMVLGVVLCLIPGVFVSVMIYLLAFVLLLGGISQIITLSRLQLPWGFYVVPVLVAVTGVVMIFAGSDKDSSAIVLVTGIVMVLYAINTVVEYTRVRKLLKN